MYPSPLPMPIPSTPHSQNIAETVRQVDDLVQDPEDEKEEMMLVTTVAPGHILRVVFLLVLERNLSILPRMVHSHRS